MDKGHGIMTNKYCYNNFFNETFFGEEKMKIREWSNLNIFQNPPFPDIYNHFLVHGHSSWCTFRLHLVKGPKTLQIDFLRKWTLEVGP